MAEQLESVEALVEDYGGSDWKAATRQEERTALWAARHNAFWAINNHCRNTAQARSIIVLA